MHKAIYLPVIKEHNSKTSAILYHRLNCYCRCTGENLTVLDTLTNMLTMICHLISKKAYT